MAASFRNRAQTLSPSGRCFFSHRFRPLPQNTLPESCPRRLLSFLAARFSFLEQKISQIKPNFSFVCNAGLQKRTQSNPIFGFLANGPPLASAECGNAPPR
jgi:hypothetical protein